jgi:hypothetical protein
VLCPPCLDSAAEIIRKERIDSEKMRMREKAREKFPCEGGHVFFSAEFLAKFLKSCDNFFDFIALTWTSLWALLLIIVDTGKENSRLADVSADTLEHCLRLQQYALFGRSNGESPRFPARGRALHQSRSIHVHICKQRRSTEAEWKIYEAPQD